MLNSYCLDALFCYKFACYDFFISLTVSIKINKAITKYITFTGSISYQPTSKRRKVIQFVCIYIYINDCSSIIFEKRFRFSQFFFCQNDFLFPVGPLLIVLPSENLKFFCLSVLIFVWAVNHVKINQLSQKLDMFFFFF